MKKIVLCAAALISTQVAFASDVEQKAEPEERKQVCTREKPVGTNRPVRVCRDAEAAQEVGDRTRDAYETVLRQRHMPTEPTP